MTVVICPKCKGTMIDPQCYFMANGYPKTTGRLVLSHKIECPSCEYIDYAKKFVEEIEKKWKNE